MACWAQLIGRIQNYASREGMNIDQLGEKTVRELVDKEMVKTLADLYELTSDDLMNLEHLRRNRHKTVRRHSDAKKRRLDRFLYALGNRRIGRQLAQEFGSLADIRNARENELERILPWDRRLPPACFNSSARRKINKSYGDWKS